MQASISQFILTISIGVWRLDSFYTQRFREVVDTGVCCLSREVWQAGRHCVEQVSRHAHINCDHALVGKQDEAQFLLAIKALDFTVGRNGVVSWDDSATRVDKWVAVSATLTILGLLRKG